MSDRYYEDNDRRYGWPIGTTAAQMSESSIRQHAEAGNLYGYTGLFTILKHPYASPYECAQSLGFLPHFLSPLSEQSAREQLDRNYKHGGGWHPMKGWTLDPSNGWMTYPDDPVYKPIAVAQLRDETIYVYPDAWVSIVQKDGSYEVARMD